MVRVVRFLEGCTGTYCNSYAYTPDEFLGKYEPLILEEKKPDKIVKAKKLSARNLLGVTK